MVILPNTDGSIEVLEPLDFDRLRLRASRHTGLKSGEAVVVAAKGGVAWVSEAVLRRWPGGERLAGWKEGLDQMIGFVAAEGGFELQSGRLRARIEWE